MTQFQLEKKTIIFTAIASPTSTNVLSRTPIKSFPMGRRKN